MSQVNDAQEDVRRFWDRKPCDSELSDKSRESTGYYLEIEKDRYSNQAHILEILGWVDWRGKRVLEIGTGVGTDARQIIARGGTYTGINVDEGSVTATAEGLRVFGLGGAVRQCSATNMDFHDGAFDLVYSFGVLHHIPDVQSAIAEIHRVLKPGGQLLIMVYNESSINYHIEIMFLRKIMVRVLGLPGIISLLSRMGFSRAKLERHAELQRQVPMMSKEEWISRNTDGPDNPYSRVYGHDDAEKLLKGFTVNRHELFFFDPRHWGVLGRYLPERFVHELGRRWGWHRVVLATKA